MRSFVIAAVMTALVAGLGAAFAPERVAVAPRAATEDDAPGASELDDGGRFAGSSAASEAPSELARATTRTFYQWTDERGSVHFARSLEEVPPAWRETAGRVDVDLSAYTKTRAAPEGARPQAPAYATARDVTVYTAPWCGWCRKTLAFLDQRGVDYVNKDIERNERWADELYEKSGGRSIPFVEIDGTQIRGYSPHEMAALLE
jgi:glutaredoxin